MVSDFIFHLRDSKVYLCDVKTTNTSVYLSEKTLLLFCLWDTFARISIQMICFSIKLKTEWSDIFFQNAVRESIM